MEIIPAIDLIDGACVRLYKGDYGKKVKYFDDPVEVAEKWLELGAKWIRLIDLDGGRTGFPKKYDACIEYGGWIRNWETLHNVMEAGVDKIIIGTKAIESLESLKEYYIKS